MRPILALIVLALTLAGADAGGQPAGTLERHELIIRDFHTESGAVLPEARLVYATLGRLNAAGDNAILLPSHYMASFTQKKPLCQ